VNCRLAKTKFDRSKDPGVPCKSCKSDQNRVFNGEIAIHFPGLAGLDKPIVWVFPKLRVCLGCGLAEFEIPESELRVLEEGDSAVKLSRSCGE